MSLEKYFAEQYRTFEVEQAAARMDAFNEALLNAEKQLDSMDDSYDGIMGTAEIVGNIRATSRDNVKYLELCYKTPDSDKLKESIVKFITDKIAQHPKFADGIKQAVHENGNKGLSDAVFPAKKLSAPAVSALTASNAERSVTG